MSASPAFVIEITNHHSFDILEAALQRFDCHLSNEKDRLQLRIASGIEAGDDVTEYYEELEMVRLRETRLAALNKDVIAAIRRRLAEAA